MQQLRKEFVQAKTILQLILERELLQEANYRTEREIFKRRVQQINDSIEDSSYRSESFPASQEFSFHEPLFRPLWFQSINKSTSYDTMTALEASKGSGAGFEQDEVASSIDGGASFLSGNKKRASLGSLSRNGRLSTSLEDSFESSKDRKSLLPGGSGNGRKRKNKEKMVMYTLNKNGEVEIVPILESTGGSGGGGAMTTGSRRHAALSSTHVDSDLVIPYNGYTAPSILEVLPSMSSSSAAPTAAETVGEVSSSPAVAGTGTAVAGVSVARDYRVIHDQVEGPRYVCNPQWPNFTQTLASSSSATTTAAVASSSSPATTISASIKEPVRKLLFDRC